MRIINLPQRRVWGAYDPRLHIGLGVMLLYHGTEKEFKNRLMHWLEKTYHISNAEMVKLRETTVLGMNYSEWLVDVKDEIKVSTISSLETDDIFSEDFMLIRFLISTRAAEEVNPAILSQAKALLLLAERGIPEIGIDLKFQKIVSPNEKWEIEIPYGWKVTPLGTHGDGVLVYSGRARLLIDVIVDEDISINDYVKEELNFVRGNLPLIQKPVITRDGKTVEIYLLVMHGTDAYVYLTRFHVNELSRYVPGVKLLLKMKAVFPLRTLIDFNKIMNQIISSWRPRKLWLAEYLKLYDTDEDFRTIANQYSEILTDLLHKKF